MSAVPVKPTLDRRAAVKRLLADRGDLLVVSGLGSATYDVYAAGDNDANFYLWGAMGSAALVGLGLALAKPTRAVAVLTGDGEQLMGLGGLATIAIKRPPNLTLIVLDNGHFGETGMQLSHTGLGLELHRIAAAAGFMASREVRDLEGVAALRADLHQTTGGPRFATLHISTDEVERALAPRDGVFVKNRFREHLGFPVV
jgi:thiamine pyrophosphate-dependent acetolactate synthase large subunit-like protein